MPGPGLQRGLPAMRHGDGLDNRQPQPAAAAAVGPAALAEAGGARTGLRAGRGVPGAGQRIRIGPGGGAMVCCPWPGFAAGTPAGPA